MPNGLFDKCSPATGFTLWELLCAMTVAGVALSLAIPGLGDMLANAERRASVDAFIAAVQLARSEAAKRGRRVVLCPSSNADRCAATADFSSGWIVYVAGDDPSAPPGGEALLRADAPTMRGAIVTNRSAFEFRPWLSRSTNGTVTFCDTRGWSHARAVVISYTGRPRIARLEAHEFAGRCDA